MSTQFPSIASLFANLSPPTGFTFDELARNEIDTLIALLESWYPTLRTGIEGVHLDPNYFVNEVKLKNEPQTSQTEWTIVAKHKQHIAGIYSIKHITRARQIAGRLIAIDPTFRKSGLAGFGLQVLEALGLNLSAAMIWGTATLSHTVSQHTMAKQGFRLRGIFPAFDLDFFEPHGSKFVCEAIYCKVLAKSEVMAKPERSNMASEVQALWDFLALEELFPH